MRVLITLRAVRTRITRNEAATSRHFQLEKQAGPATTAEVEAQAIKSAEQNYASYASTFLSPLMGQRAVPVVLLIVCEIVLTPLYS